MSADESLAGESEELGGVGGGEESQQQAAADLKTLGDLLAVDEAGEETAGAEQEQGAGGSQESTELKQFNDLAGRLDLELDDLYNLEISMEGGEAVSIEALKDAYKGNADFELERIEFEEQRTEQTKELMRANQELQEILQALPEKAVSPQVLEKIRAKHEATRTLEQQRTLRAIPEWKDAERREADVAGMAEHLAEYGFPIDYLSQVVNHQQLAYIRDNWQRSERMKKALEQVRAGKPEKRASGKKAAGKAPKRNPIDPKNVPGQDKLATVLLSN